ncbi:hypothetical protein GCM10023225_34580 [Kineococcus glutinatus]|uniref:TadE-like domain-containing protein n=1 Tax=Kineococcus glutinatus TaxID=1070872 RepID=A0ABP8VHY1_9ACTN
MGSTSLEMAFVAPALLLLVFVLVQAGLFLHGRDVALQAAREGVSQLRLVSSQQQADALHDDVERGVVGFARAVGRESLLAPTATARWYLDADGDARVEVRVSGRVVSLVPGWDLRTEQTAHGEVERFEAWR